MKNLQKLNSPEIEFLSGVREPEWNELMFTDVYVWIYELQYFAQLQSSYLRLVWIYVWIRFFIIIVEGPHPMSIGSWSVWFEKGTRGIEEGSVFAKPIVFSSESKGIPPRPRLPP